MDLEEFDKRMEVLGAFFRAVSARLGVHRAPLALSAVRSLKAEGLEVDTYTLGKQSVN